MTKVLVVDDSAMDRRIAGGLLEKNLGWIVTYAVDGKQAFAQLDESPPDLILTDLQMPEMNGLELVQAVKRTHPLIPVVLMTAQGSEVIAVEALEQGASSYVPKDQLGHDLCDTLERVVAAAGDRRTQRQLMQQIRTLDCTFVLNNDPSMLTSLVAYLQTLLNDMGLLAEVERLRVGVALEEALLNAAYHGNLEVSSDLRETDHTAYYQLARERTTQEPYANRSIYVEAKLNREEVRYTIRDEGPGFNPSELPDPTDPANLERPCGRGLLLMRTFMDEIEYNDIGNKVVMVKRAASVLSDIEAPEPAPI
ncbi:MAG: ATP-binding protein [Planctomycetaceae bacterium]|nr:ATP-binding protein [Planctomycetaceae bacterium]